MSETQIDDVLRDKMLTQGLSLDKHVLYRSSNDMVAALKGLLQGTEA